VRCVIKRVEIFLFKKLKYFYLTDLLWKSSPKNENLKSFQT